jgi:ubiquinone/menaquinone biosynthesis C-methylase UbiE
MKQQSTDRIFSEVSSDYAKHRPSYAASAIDKILEGLQAPSQLVVVDIGAGTGIASRQMAERGVKVLAVEPDPAMIQAATPHPRVEFRVAKAEATNLPDSFADLVTCFTAFHWFDFEPSLREFRRILKPSGRLALIWNPWDSTDPFTRRYSQLVFKASKRHRTRMTPYGNYPFGYVKLARMGLLRYFRWMPYFTNVRCYSFAHQQTAKLETLIGCARSQSFVPLEGALWEQLVLDLESLVESSEATYNLAYKTISLLAQPASTASK